MATVAPSPAVSPGTLSWFAVASRELSPPAVGARRQAWLASARPTQLPPEGDDWDVWLILAGRGFGKTRAGAEHVAQFARENAGAEIGVIGRTDAEARRLLLNGPSGLLAVLDPDDLDPSYGAGKGYVESPGDSKIKLRNGATIYVTGANSPDALRGLNLWMAWCDELAAWRYQQTIWDEVLDPAVRIGPHPHVLVTTTPRPTKLIRTLLHDVGSRVVRGSTFDNAANLAAKFLRRMRRKYDVDENGRARTRAGRQEINAEVLDDVPGALVTQAQLDAYRVVPRIADDGELYLPAGVKLEGRFREAVVALDPSDGTEDGDEQALALVGLGWDHDLYVESVVGMRASPTEYLGAAVDMAVKHAATLVVEKNHGGKYLLATLEQVMRDRDVTVPVRVVTASDGKRTRAEPIAPLFVQGKLRLVGVHTEVEDQLTSWVADGKHKSPDRMDALVWGVSHFLRHSLAAPDDGDDGSAYAYSTGSDDWAADADSGAYTYD